MTRRKLNNTFTIWHVIFRGFPSRQFGARRNCPAQMGHRLKGGPGSIYDKAAVTMTAASAATIALSVSPALFCFDLRCSSPLLVQDR